MKLKTFLLGLLLFLSFIVLPFWIIFPYLLILLGKYLNLPVLEFYLFKPFGIILIFAGIIGSLHTFFLFRKFGKGTPAPILPTKKLVIKGLYKYTRNPMYLFYIAVILGNFFIFGQLLFLIYLLIFYLGVNFYVTKYEEPNLKKKFGEEYINYTKKVPRWL